MLSCYLLIALVTYVACQTDLPATSAKCPAHEIFSECAPVCPEYCDGPAIRCQSCRAGCACQPGFVRDRKTGRCINKRQCHPNTGPCAMVRCQKCDTCKADTNKYPHCIPSSDVCCNPPLSKVECVTNPCDTTKCSYPNATCIPYYCGGCETRFYDANLRLLTKEQCSPQA